MKRGQGPYIRQVFLKQLQHSVYMNYQAPLYDWLPVVTIRGAQSLPSQYLPVAGAVRP